MDILTAGLDIGSVGVKAVLMKNGQIISTVLMPTGWNPGDSGEKAMHQLFDVAGIHQEDVTYTIATGYGRKAFKRANKYITEITCHAIGARYLFPEVNAILDIGGQDSKTIRLGEAGEVLDFLMNDKCAAGTGRFLESMAILLEYEFKDFSELPCGIEPHRISSMCTVFAESEVIGLLAKGIDKQSIALGLLDSIASRAEGMIKRLGGNGSIVFTGGLSKSKNLVAFLEKRLSRTVLCSEMSQFAGAIGAALLGE